MAWLFKLQYQEVAVAPPSIFIFAIWGPGAGPSRPGKLPLAGYFTDTRRAIIAGRALQGQERMEQKKPLGQYGAISARLSAGAMLLCLVVPAKNVFV